MGAKKLNIVNEPNAAKVIEDLELSASIYEKDLIWYLDVEGKTIHNWRSKSETPKAHSGKLVRLYQLKQVVDAAINNSLPKTMIRQLLVAPMDVQDEHQVSIVDYIQSEPDPKFFGQVVSMFVEQFRRRQANSGQYILKNEDFDRLIGELQNEKDPSEAVKKARERFQKFRKDG